LTWKRGSDVARITAFVFTQKKKKIYLDHAFVLTLVKLTIGGASKPYFQKKSLYGGRG
jgi:hypothetical protein